MKDTIALIPIGNIDHALLENLKENKGAPYERIVGIIDRVIKIILNRQAKINTCHFLLKA